MKKVFNYLRSMRFGILLLALIAAGSVIGSLLPQGRALAWYAENYPGAYLLIYRTGIYDIYHSWYFQLLLVLLCLNLLLCSVLRLKGVIRGGKNALAQAEKLPVTIPLSPEEREQVRDYLIARRCREEKRGDFSLLYKNGFGRYGTFLTHLSILLTVVVGAAALYLPVELDRSCMPGESIVLDDGTEITVDAFSMMNDSGKLDYASKIRITLPDGRESGVREIKVNHPTTFGRYKIYQWTWGVKGSVFVVNLTNRAGEQFSLEENSFLSADGINGIEYVGLYEINSQEESGPSGGNTYAAYQIYVVSEGSSVPMMLLPEESVTVGDLEFTFRDPYYPGLRIKQMPPAVNELLIAVFALMVAALYITFFLPPVLVKLTETGCAVGGPKPENTRMEILNLLSRERGETL